MRVARSGSSALHRPVAVRSAPPLMPRCAACGGAGRDGAQLLLGGLLHLLERPRVPLAALELELEPVPRSPNFLWPTSAHSSRPARPRTGSVGTAVLVEVGARLGRPNSYSTRRRAPPSAARPLGPRRSRNSRRRRTRGPPCCRSAGAGPTSSLRRPVCVNCAFRVAACRPRFDSRSRGACSLPAHRPRRPPARRTSARPAGSGSACTAGCAKNVFGPLAF